MYGMMENMKDTMKQIADKVRGVAAEKHVTQQAMANLLGMSRAAFSDRINGKVPFGAHEILALANHFDVPVTRLFPDLFTERAA